MNSLGTGTISLSRPRFRAGGIAALLVISSMLVANNFQHNTDRYRLAASSLYAVGWGFMALALVQGRLSGGDRNLGVLALVACATVLVSTLCIRDAVSKDRKPPGEAVAGYFFGWLVIVYAVSQFVPAAQQGRALGIAVAGACALTYSMLGAMPIQRLTCSVDGPGLPLYTSGWLAVAFANALT